MFSKIVCGIFLIWSFSEYAKVDAQCMSLLTRYYQCKNPNTTLDDAFFSAQLNGITTFNAAMEKFKAIYNELDWNTCSSALCICVKGDPTLGIMNYGTFFVNPSYYSDMVSILSALRNKYTRITNSPLEIMQQFNLMSNISNFTLMSTVSQFCNNYDFTAMDLSHYNETMSCLMKASMSSLTCIGDFSNFTGPFNYNDIIKKYEKHLICSIGVISSCSVEIKRVIILNFLIGNPGLLNNGLLTYIDSVISSAEAEAKNATVVWVTGDPHIYSVNKGMETCNFDMTLVCVQSDNVTVNCTGEKISNTSSVTILSEIKIRFTKNGQTSDFIANQASFPTTFSNGQEKLQDTNGKDWLKLTSFGSKNFIVITDLNSNMVISIGKFSRNYFMVIQAPKMAYKPGGILLDGCPLQFQGVRLTASRKKRASSNAASVCSSSTQQSGSSLISSSDLYAGCVNDVVVTGDESYATMYKSTLDAYSEVKTTYSATFTSGALQLRSTFSNVLLIIGFFLFKYF